ncbi:lipase secretion chaperone [Marinobacter sp. DUT-3]|uniref:lipase secretion chaperone n=1 Tax=Marinobacter sp. DUT-3 TaxID=3412036 RepID=UPI003D16564B
MSVSHRRLMCCAAVAAVFAVIVGVQPLTQPDQHTAATSEVATVSNPTAFTTGSKLDTNNDQVHASALTQRSELGPLPASLQGAEPSVVLTTDEQGNLVPEHDLLILFDFYLSALGEEPLDLLLSRIRQSLGDRLEGQALAQAQDLLRRYVDYRIALGDIEGSSTPVTSNGMAPVSNLRERFQQMTALRQELFSQAEGEAFFQLDNVQDEYMLQRLTIEQNPSLNDQQRQQAIASLDQTLPEEIRAVRQRVTRDAELYVTTESMRRTGAGEEEIYKVRAETLGHTSAANLAALDRKREKWDQRLSEYARERDAIRESGLSRADRESAVDTLIEDRFDALEGKRVRALDSEL